MRAARPLVLVAYGRHIVSVVRAATGGTPSELIVYGAHVFAA